MNRDNGERPNGMMLVPLPKEIPHSEILHVWALWQLATLASLNKKQEKRQTMQKDES